MPVRLRREPPPPESRIPSRAHEPLGGLQVVLLLSAAWTLAVPMPLLELLSRNATFLVAHDLLGGRLVLFALAAVMVAPVLLASVVILAGRLASKVGWLALVFLVGALFSAMLLMVVSRWAPFGGAATAVGSLALGLFFAWRLLSQVILRQFLSILGVGAPAAVLAFFLLVSPASALTQDVSGASASSAARHAVPVFILLLDELPLSSLMTVDGTVDGDLFPAFADLAASASWFPNATTVSTNTERAVPAILTGRLPATDAKLPTAAEHPGGLFELLDGTDILTVEPITRMCAVSTCRTVTGRVSHAGTGVSVTVTLLDTAIIYLHQVLPRALAEGLPPIDESWVGFGRGDGPPDTDDTIQSSEDEEHAQRVTRAVWDDSSVAARQFIESVESAGPSSLYFGHFMLPHSPWTHLPDGSVFQVRRVAEPGRAQGGAWGDNDWLITHAYRRHLLQVQFTDLILGEFIDAVRERGLWDDALVIVLSDHGIAWEMGARRRSTATPEAAADVMHVPLFVKVPGQSEGQRSAFPALVTDVAPTVADVLGLEPRPDYAGTSLLDIDDAATTDPERGRGLSSAQTLRNAAARKYRLFDLQHGSPGLFAFGDHSDLVGSRLPSGPAPPGTPSIEIAELDDLGHIDRAGGFVPALISGRLTDLQGDSPETIAFTIDGIVAGIAETYTDSEGHLRFQTLLDPRFLPDGTHRIQAFSVEDSPTGPFLRRLKIVQ